ncbi:hydroxylamine reductase [Synergistaceae bacterium OttesenSCG-928-D05]|nr:hydroxylamine reductase [Synergistaceae bacterium OttesenSCG-928-D05]
MFCYQCEQRAKGTGCTVAGVCGKDEKTSDLQDLLVHETMLLSKTALGKDKVKEAAKTVVDNLFTTVTNVNFDAETIVRDIKETRELRSFLENGEGCNDACQCGNAMTLDEMVASAKELSPMHDIEKYGADLGGLKWLAIYGLKGTAAYAHHARVLGQQDDAVNHFFVESMAALLDENITVDSMLALNLKIGEVNLRVMELLDAGNTGTYGHPEPTMVRVTPIKGKAILVSGHDLADLEALLKQTEGKGVNIYTHGEMLPCNAYPGLKKYKHLVGNYGGAWQDQQKEFDEFPGAILMTTNCIQRPKPSYMDRIFTCGLVEWPGVKHIENRDFAPVIESALAAPGFAEDAPEQKIMIGFAHNAVMGAAGKVIELVQAGKIRHFFLVGGCDGAKPGRNYYTEFAEKAPKDTVILTLACGKFRFNKMEFGDIEGIPRLLDCGQCNDAYSAIRIAVALAEAFKTDVNGLPLSLVLSWYEQKAVCILLTLLHLGIKNIRLGPSLPSFIGPEVLNVLVENFGIAPTTTADEDLHTILG